MIKGYIDIDIWNIGFFINVDYFFDDFIIYNNMGKDFICKIFVYFFFYNNLYKMIYILFILCFFGIFEIEIDFINYFIKENILLMMVFN